MKSLTKTDVASSEATASSITPQGQEDSHIRRGARNFLPPILLGLIIIGLWYFISYGILDEQRRFLLRPPP